MVKLQKLEKTDIILIIIVLVLIVVNLVIYSKKIGQPKYMMQQISKNKVKHRLDFLLALMI